MTQPVWYYVRREDGLVVNADTGRPVVDPVLAAAVSDHPEAFRGQVVDKFPNGKDVTLWTRNL